MGLASAICPMYIAEIARAVSAVHCFLEPVCHHLRSVGSLFCQLPHLRRHLNPVVEIVDGVNRIMNPEDA